jgi:hypothetical protein
MMTDVLAVIESRKLSIPPKCYSRSLSILIGGIRARKKNA